MTEMTEKVQERRKKRAKPSANGFAHKANSPKLGKTKLSTGNSTLSIRKNQFEITKNVARAFAVAVVADIRPYLESHQEEFKAWLAEQESGLGV